MNNFYVIEYKSGERGCPFLFKADLNNDWQWDVYDSNPDKFNITFDYVYKAKHQVIDFDFGYQGHPVSEKFLHLCDEFGMRYRAIPVEMLQSNKKPTEKKYFFLLTKDFLSIIDLHKSTYELARVLETGEIFKSKLFPGNPHFEIIEKFVVDESKANDCNIFRCTDIQIQFVCSQRFKDACEKAKLLGLNFIPIETYQSIPFWRK